MKSSPMQYAAPLLVALAVSAQAGLITETRSFLVGLEVADFQDPPRSFLEVVTDSAIVSLTRVEMGLHLVGLGPGFGFASEMYVALNKDLGSSSILLNQVGLSATDPVGSGYDGWEVTFSDDAPNGDVHWAALDFGVLTGRWAPDGRTDPTDDGTRSRLLDVFVGQAGNGEWRLAVGDLALGGSMRLESWSLTLVGEDGLGPMPVPEGGLGWASWIMLLAGLASSRGRFGHVVRR